MTETASSGISLERTNLLLAEAIAHANHSELVNMCTLRGLDTSGTDQQLRRRLLEYHGISDSKVDVIETDQSYKLEIVSAQRMRSAGNDDSLLVLEGNVVISFLASGQGEPKKLQASRIVIDLVNSRLTAMGGVSFVDSTSDSAVQEVGGDIVSFNWNTGNLEVSGGTTTSDKKNSDGKSVIFFTSGDQINYRGDAGGIQIHQGFVTTNPDTAYSSITAQSMSLLPGGDMFVTNAYLSIGRVPVFWVPFFFYPGSTLVFNPAFGFASDRGMFLNTTYEFYGSYPNFKSSKQSSFTSLLATQTDADLVKDGLVYSEGTIDTSDPFAAWVKKSGSYLVMMADVYQKAGIYVGLDSSTRLLDKKLVIDANGGFAFTPKTFGSTLGSSYRPTFRYMGNFGVKLDTKMVDLSLAMPFYSDPAVRTLYGNRLSNFSMDALFGAHQDFPTDYSGTISSFSWKMGGTFTLPSNLASPYISKLKISKFDASMDFQWKKTDSIYSYQIVSTTLPELSASMGGTLFSFKKPVASTASKTNDQLTALEQELASFKAIDIELEPLDYDEQALLVDEEPAIEVVNPFDSTILPEAYKASSSTKTSGSSSGSHALSLAYSIDQTLTNKYAATTSVESLFGPQTLYSSTKGAFILSGNIAPSWFSFTQTFSPTVTYASEDANNHYKSTQMQFVSTTVAKIPLLGLTYELGAKVYQYQKVESDKLPAEIIERWASWNSSTITTHRLTFSKAFSTPIGTFTPSLTGTLPPLTFSLLPALNWKLGNWTAGASYKFVDNGRGGMNPDLASLSFGYAGKYVDTKWTGTYQTANYDPLESFWDPFSLNGHFTLYFFDKTLSVKQTMKFSVATSSGRYMFNDLTTSLSYRRLADKSPLAMASVTFSGTSDDVKLSAFDFQSNLADLSFSWWKRRIKLGFTLDTRFHFDFIDKYSTNLSITAKVNFLIAEFLSLSFSVTSSNNGFYLYYDQNNVFQWSLMFEDLWRSFDFGGDGRSRTQFNMESMSVELIHYMEDWDLHCKYTGSVVLSGYKWEWVPKVSVYLQWNTIPELKVDEKWTRVNSVWKKGT